MATLNCCIKYFYKYLLITTRVFPSFATRFYHEVLLFTLDFFPKLSSIWGRVNNLFPSNPTQLSPYFNTLFAPSNCCYCQSLYPAVNSDLH